MDIFGDGMENSQEKVRIFIQKSSSQSRLRLAAACIGGGFFVKLAIISVLSPILSIKKKKAWVDTICASPGSEYGERMRKEVRFAHNENETKRRINYDCKVD